jgi:hypothetical protein
MLLRPLIENFQLDLFSKDVILIPINHNQMHWSAAVINFRENRIESYDSLDAENKGKGQLFELLRGYLQDEHREKKGSDFDFTGWKNFGRPVSSHNFWFEVDVASFRTHPNKRTVMIAAYLL